MMRSEGTTRRKHFPSDSRSGSPTSISSDESSLRKSGIPLIGDLPWGAHICAFYETTNDLLDAAIGYFQAGFENREFCLWAVSKPVSKANAQQALRKAVPKFDLYRARGQIEILDGREWYLKGSQFDLQRITGGWNDKLNAAVAAGYEGIRISGNAFWIATNHWKEFCEYEQVLDRELAGRKMLVLCTYSMTAARAVDILDVARAHKYTIARRRGKWEFLETPELVEARREITRLTAVLDILSKPFPGHAALTARERAILAQIVMGSSNKEIARTLEISPRTAEFHRANIMKKLHAKNTAELVRKVLRGR